MARKVRFEYPGACYHLINRGNYRSRIFESEGARKSFVGTLRECCEAQGWSLHAWCLMSNHYHLLLETPEPNLVEGMRWLQSVFANRFNRFRKENGHVFQGRYKSIILEDAAMGPVAHYIHLNPVRARMVTADQLERYEWSSFHQLWYPEKRWSFMAVAGLLKTWLGLADDRASHRAYRDYLQDLAGDRKEKERLGFGEMSSGWAKGSDAFKRDVLKDMDEAKSGRVVEGEAGEIREHRWQRALEEGLTCLKRTTEDLKKGRKGEPWKVALACHLRERYLVPHRWLARELRMGAVSSVQSAVSRHRQAMAKAGKDPDWKELERIKKS